MNDSLSRDALVYLYVGQTLHNSVYGMEEGNREGDTVQTIWLKRVQCNEWDNYRIIGEKMSVKQRHLKSTPLSSTLFEIAPMSLFLPSLASG